MKRGAMLVAGLTAMTYGIGCSSAEVSPTQSTHPTIITTCEVQDKWTNVPANLNIPYVAEKLGINEERVTAGKWGPALCKDTVELAQISLGNIAVSVKDIGNLCLALGTMDRPDQVVGSKRLLIVCPSI